MRTALVGHLADQIEGLHAAGLYKTERVISSPQDAHITLQNGVETLNFCANNYLGLAADERMVTAARHALLDHGYGMASVRFICGTQDIHKELENRISSFLGTEDTILYSSCFDANTGLFETILDETDAVVSDALNHASIIDGIRLCKAQRYRYANNDMTELAARLEEAAGARHRLIATDGVFSMDGVIADLGAICDLAEAHDALVVVDDSHAVGLVGDGGRGTPELTGVGERIDLYTGTLGKALGGASGGYTSGRREIIEWLRQRSRPYLFSNSLAPVIAATTLTALDLIESSSEPRQRLADNSERFRRGMTGAGFALSGNGHPIIPVMIGDEKLASEMADRLLGLGVYVIAFSFPVVPRSTARIRTQMSAAHTPADIDRAIDAFTTVGREMGLI